MLARPGAAIGVGGRPLCRAGVVRRGAGEVDLAAVPAGQLGLVAGGGVDAERHALLDAVVDDPGDLRPLLGHLRLGLDQRGDGEDLVGRQVAAWSRADGDVELAAGCTSIWPTICWSTASSVVFFGSNS